MKTLGKSKLVPSVQELVSKEESTATVSIPPRYLISEPFDDAPVSPSKHPQVPIIDMEALLSGEASELQSLHSACRDWGFFQVVNHGVSGSVTERFKTEVKEFFNLPMEEKTKYWQTTEEVEGFGQAFVVSEEQKLDWADIFFLTTLPESLQKSHLLPMLPLPFRHALESYSSEVKNLALGILGYMGQALGMEPEGYLKDLFRDGMQSMRMNYYPPCPQPDKVIGLTPHSDSVGLTILLQINEMDGLQIKKDGSWIPINPLPNAFVVNVGDVLEIVTNGVYRSIEHRAVVNPSKERLSVATFHNPGLYQMIGPALCLINPENPSHFRKIRMTEYFQGLFARELDSKSYLEVMRI